MSQRFRVAAVLCLALLSLPSLPSFVGAQTEQRTIKGSAVAIYNLVGRMRVVAGSGDAVGVDITRGGTDAAKIRIETGPLRNRETLRIIYPSDRIVYPDMRRSRTHLNVRSDGTFSEGSWDDLRDRDRVEIRGSGPGLEAYADLVVRVPAGQKIELYLGVGRVDVTNVNGNLLVDVAS